jgi:hypothetical protein
LPKIKYIDKKLSDDRLAMIAKVNEIIVEYQTNGYTLTLRQVYYQLVSRDLIPNEQAAYKRLGDVISDGRRLGLIDWEAIEDRTRNLVSPSSWDEPADIVASAAHSFRLDVWAGQPYRPFVFVEKDALLGVIEVACREHRVPYFSCRGYTSDSEIWSMARRIRSIRGVYIDTSMHAHPEEADFRQVPLILHLGDHDPSGIDMTRDIRNRLSLFAAGSEVEVRRLALNMAQIDEHSPPPNPAKTTDARYRDYEALYGDESWELDALDPATITTLIRGEVDSLIDEPTWAAWIAAEAEQREQLDDVASHWQEVVEHRNNTED